jgi:hypothetical protein
MEMDESCLETIDHYINSNCIDSLCKGKFVPVIN